MFLLVILVFFEPIKSTNSHHVSSYMVWLKTYVNHARQRAR